MQLASRAPDKRRFHATLNRQPCLEVPYFELEFAPQIVSAILGKHVQARSYLLPPSDTVELMRRTGVDVAYVVVPWLVGREERVDEKGNPYYVDGLIHSRDDLSRVAIPSLDPVRKRIEEIQCALEGTRGGWIFALPTSEGIIRAMGYETYYLALHEDPAFVDEFTELYEQYALPVTELVLSYRPDAVVIGSNLCYKTGLAMSLEHAERFVFPSLRKQLALVNAKRVPLVMHSDGDNNPLMERWIELGFAGIHPIEPCGTFDIYDVKRRYGDRIALLGNVDVFRILTQGSPDEVRADTLEHLRKLSVGSGYLCGSSHDINADVRLENLAAMIQTVCEFRSTGNS